MINILIIKQSALGDVLRTTCILSGVKRKYPNSKIAWFTKKSALDLVRTNPYINKIFLYSKESISRLKELKFNIVINLDEDYEACYLTTHFLNKKSKVYGYYINKENKIVPSVSAKYYFDMSLLGEKPKNDILKKANKKTYPELIYELAELDYKKDPPILVLTKEQKRFAQDFLRRYNLKKNDLIIGVNTGAGERWPLKKLPMDKAVELIQKLYKELNAKIILFGGPDEVERNNQIISLSKIPIINAGCGNYLFEMASLMSVCNTIVTSDSLGLHIALALKRNVVVFFGQTAPQEIEMYNQGIKVFTPSDCVGCYSSYDGRTPNCMDGVHVKDLFKAVNEVRKQSITTIILAENILESEKTINSILKQKINIPNDIIVVSKNKEIKKLNKKEIKIIIDQGADYNLLAAGLKEARNKLIIVTTDKAVLETNSINEIIKSFEDPGVGCITGRPLSLNSKNNIFGYWSHLLLDAGAHRIRKELSSKEQFLECSNYLFAFKNGFVNDIPSNIAEDHIIPYIFWKKGYKVKYVENAKVFIKNPMTLNNWLDQKTINARKHENLLKHLNIKENLKVKSFTNEIIKGTISALSYPKTIKELYWTILLFFARLTMWLNVIIKK